MPEVNATLEVAGNKPETVTITDPTDAPDIAAIQARAAKAEAELVELRNKAKEAATKEAAKRGEFERLYTETKADADAKAARLAELEAKEAARVERIAKLAETQVKALPKEAQALVAAVKAKLEPDELLAYIETVKATVSGGGVQVGAQRGVTTAAPVISAEARARIEREKGLNRMSVEDWFTKVWGGIDRTKTK